MIIYLNSPHYQYKKVKHNATTNGIITKIATVVTLFFVTENTLGQTNKKMSGKSKVAFVQKIDKVNALLKYYETLSPYVDTKNTTELIDSIGHSISTQLLDILNDQRITQYPIEKLFYQNELSISKSIDNKIYFFSLDQKTGGSYKTNTTIIQYRLVSGVVKANYFAGNTSDAIAVSNYHQVYLLDSASQRYLIIGGVQTCNTCYTSLAVTITLDSTTYQTELLAQHDDHDNGLTTFMFDSSQKVFFYEYTEAINQGAQALNKELDQFSQLFKHKFKFINGGFHEIEKCALWNKKE